MATHYIPRNVKGEGRLLYIFTTKSLITSAIGGTIGFILFYIFSALGIKVVGIILLAIFALLGFGIGTIKIPRINGIKFTKNVAGDSIDEIIVRYIKFKLNKKMYTYIDTNTDTNIDTNSNTKEEE